jgi:acetate kinase
MAMIYQKSKTGNGKASAILVINSGSSSLKLSLFSQDLTCLFDAHVKFGENHTTTLETSLSDKTAVLDVGNDIEKALHAVFLHVQQAHQFSLPPLAAIGHRFVHGGTEFSSTTKITEQVEKRLEEQVYLAPLHNPACLKGIQGCFRYFGSVPQFAVFDTAFHSTMPAVAYTYAIPMHLSAKYSIRRYGFHGISHASLWDLYAQTFPQKAEAKLITCHLGNGCSACAISSGRCLDTSMGFTPTEGLVMATRSGDIDPGIFEFLSTHEGINAAEVLNILNNQSGLLGVSELSQHMGTLISHYESQPKSALAVDLFCYRVQKYIGAYIPVLQGVDAITFSGGIGENAPLLRTRIMERFSWLGIELDDEKNRKAVHPKKGLLHKISKEGSKVVVYVAAADENRYIAKEVCLQTYP